MELRRRSDDESGIQVFTLDFFRRKINSELCSLRLFEIFRLLLKKVEVKRAIDDICKYRCDKTERTYSVEFIENVMSKRINQIDKLIRKLLSAGK